MSEIIIRKAAINDISAIQKLYQEVAKTEGGIARLQHEIYPDYIEGFVKKSLTNGLILIAVDNDTIISEIHAYRPGIAVFDHVLTDLTIVVSPEFQGKGIGKKIFSQFLETVSKEMNRIKRVELIARESNMKAIRFYESIGFTIEGRFENRIKTTKNTYEADIPMAWQNPSFQF